MNAGFYKIENDMLLYSPTTVESAEYYLTSEQPDKYEYPVDGWYWFDSEVVARDFFNFSD